MDQQIQKKLSGTFEADTLITLRAKEKDITIKTDNEGKAVMAFIGKIQANGEIKGERYVRQFVKDKDGKIVKDHWDMKGKAS